LTVAKPIEEFAEPAAAVMPAAAPPAKQPRGLLSPLMTVAATLVVFVLIVVEAQTGVMRSPGGYVGLLLLLYFLVVSAVFHLGSIITAGLLRLFEAKGSVPFASP
jgi:hypothetical protein